MNYLKNVLSTVFAADVGRSEVGIESALNAIRLNPDDRELKGIFRNFDELMKQDDFDWISLLENETYEVDVFVSHEQAKAFIIENLMKPLGYSF